MYEITRSLFGYGTKEPVPEMSGDWFRSGGPNPEWKGNNKEAPVSSGHMTALTTVLYQSVMPQNLQTVPFCFEGRQLAYYMMEAEFVTDNHGHRSCKQPPCIVLSTADSPDILTKLLRLAESSFEEYQRKWIQHVHTLDSDGSRCFWTRMKTDSCKTMDNLVMEPSLKRDLEADLNQFLTSEKWYKRVGVTYKRGYLFYGDPGCGKSSAISAVSNLCKYDIYMFNLSVTTTDELFRNAFRQIPSKALVVFEDIDCDTEVTHARHEEPAGNRRYR